jgi:hypothetical protein
MTHQETRKKLVAAFALTMTQLDPALPDDLRQVFLTDMIVKAAQALIDLNGGCATQSSVSEVFDGIDGEVRALLAKMPHMSDEAPPSLTQ